MKILKSIGAIVAGMATVFILSHLTDFILERTGVMKLPFNENSLGIKLLVIVYRNLYVITGSYIAAALAPREPMKHVYVFALLGCVLGILGAIAMWHEPPHWYPVSLIVLGIPSAILGGKLLKIRRLRI